MKKFVIEFKDLAKTVQDNLGGTCKSSILYKKWLPCIV